MFEALQNAASGMLSSADRAALAARNIVMAAQNQSSDYSADQSDVTRGNTAYQIASRGGPSGVTPASGRSGALSSFSGMPSDLLGAPKPLEEEIVNLKIAVQAYRANAAVFRTASETSGSLLKIKV